MNRFLTLDWLAMEATRRVINEWKAEPEGLIGTSQQPSDSLPHRAVAYVRYNPMGDPDDLSHRLKRPARRLARKLKSARQIAVLPFPEIGPTGGHIVSRCVSKVDAFSLLAVQESDHDKRGWRVRLEVGYA